jgi:hypothetical protein
MMVSDHFIRSPTLRSLARFTSLSIFLDSVMEAIAKLPLKSRGCKVVVFFITLSIGTPVVVLAWLRPSWLQRPSSSTIGRCDSPRGCGHAIGGCRTTSQYLWALVWPLEFLVQVVLVIVPSSIDGHPTSSSTPYLNCQGGPLMPRMPRCIHR